jgi:hypothetical protein
MHPVDFYELAQHDRKQVARHLRCYDAPGLRWFADACAQHLLERFGVSVPPGAVLGTWQHVALVSERQVQEATKLQERAIGE